MYCALFSALCALYCGVVLSWLIILWSTVRRQNEEKNNDDSQPEHSSRSQYTIYLLPTLDPYIARIPRALASRYILLALSSTMEVLISHLDSLKIESPSLSMEDTSHLRSVNIEPNPLLDLPVELKLQILSNLRVKEIVCCRQVCRHFRDLVDTKANVILLTRPIETRERSDCSDLWTATLNTAPKRRS